MIKVLIGIAIGIFIGVFFTVDYYEDRYIKLRSEIILATGTDISYPYKDDEQKTQQLLVSWGIARADDE